MESPGVFPLLHSDLCKHSRKGFSYYVLVMDAEICRSNAHPVLNPSSKYKALLRIPFDKTLHQFATPKCSATVHANWQSLCTRSLQQHYIRRLPRRHKIDKLFRLTCTLAFSQSFCKRCDLYSQRSFKAYRHIRLSCSSRNCYNLNTP